MVLTEFNEEVYKKGIYEEGFAEGKTETILLFCKNGKISLKDASEMLNLPVSEVEKMMTDTEKLS